MNNRRAQWIRIFGPEAANQRPGLLGFNNPREVEAWIVAQGIALVSFNFWHRRDDCGCFQWNLMSAGHRFSVRMDDDMGNPCAQIRRNWESPMHAV